MLCVTRCQEGFRYERGGHELSGQRLGSGDFFRVINRLMSRTIVVSVVA
jgi:hypothetical protein